MMQNTTGRSRPALATAVGLLAIGGTPASVAAGVDCLDTGAALSYWRPLKEQAAASEVPPDALALELLSCLGSPDAELRDRIGYELYAYWLRNEQLTDETRRALLDRLQRNLDAPAPEVALRRSFSALILAELMRSDSRKPFMSDAERRDLLAKASAALENETDFRGLEPSIGWVHPVAHEADLLWRFALHPETTADEATLLLAAVNSKLAETRVFYRFNEPDRLARVVSVLIRRKLLAPTATNDWLQQFESRRSAAKWSEAFQSEAGMAELHNTKLFLRALSDQLSEVEYNDETGELLHALLKGFTLLI